MTDADDRDIGEDGKKEFTVNELYLVALRLIPAGERFEHYNGPKSKGEFSELGEVHIAAYRYVSCKMGLHC